MSDTSAAMAGSRATRSGRPLWLRAIDAVSGACGALAATLILVAVLLTCQMIWVRTVHNASTVWQTETVIYLMIGATLMGLPYVQRLRGHVSVDLLPRLLPPAGARVLGVLVQLAAIAVIAVMLWYGYEMWHLAWDRGWKSDTVWGPPLWIPYLAMPVGLGLYLVQLIADLAALALGIDEPFAPGDVATKVPADAASSAIAPSARGH